MNTNTPDRSVGNLRKELIIHSVFRLEFSGYEIGLLVSLSIPSLVCDQVEGFLGVKFPTFSPDPYHRPTPSRAGVEDSPQLPPGEGWDPPYNIYI